ncbi:hypothetical protein ACQ4M4_00015 [Leptolyngbya sp. AN02str]|uniref:hypothetical protein n=1 Tax=Leptolyngbya sp. AN02str TaxID=3423363 RepID=UPI003D3115BC
MTQPPESSESNLPHGDADAPVSAEPPRDERLSNDSSSLGSTPVGDEPANEPGETGWPVSPDLIEDLNEEAIAPVTEELGEIPSSDSGAHESGIAEPEVAEPGEIPVTTSQAEIPQGETSQPTAAASSPISQADPPAIASVPPTPPPASPPPPGPADSKTFQERWKEVEPAVKSRTLAVLKGTIRFLTGIVNWLEKEPEPRPESGVKKALGQVQTVSRQVAEAAQPVLRQAGPLAQRFWAWWTGTAIPKIRGFLPISVNDVLSDKALSGLIAGLLVLVLWIVPNLGSSTPKPSQVSQVPPAEVKPTTKTTSKPVATTPSPAIATKPSPVPMRSPQFTPSPKPIPAIPATPSTSVQPAPEEPKGAIAPPTPSPIPAAPVALTPSPSPSAIATPAPSPTPTPKPKLELTPEQKLIASIQDQVAQVTDQYSSGLIQSVQANFRRSLLSVTVGEGWYGLSPSQQNKLADEMLGRSQKLDFSKLEITDSNGDLLARSPVIGTNMIIVKRSQTTETT